MQIKTGCGQASGCFLSIKTGFSLMPFCMWLLGAYGGIPAHQCNMEAARQPETYSGNHPCDCRVFGWTRANEITNGRWVMFGVFVGLLTEYSTGVDFVNQLKLMVSYLGIADIYD